MQTYFEAYRQRLTNVHNNMTAMADHFTEQGYIVKYFSSKKDRLTGITVYEKDLSKGVRIQFNEVPYRINLEYAIKPNEKTGSGYSHTDEFNYNTIFTINEIKPYFQPMYIDKRFDSYYTVHGVK